MGKLMLWKEILSGSEKHEAGSCVYLQVTRSQRLEEKKKNYMLIGWRAKRGAFVEERTEIMNRNPRRKRSRACQSQSHTTGSERRVRKKPKLGWDTTPLPRNKNFFFFVNKGQKFALTLSLLRGNLRDSWRINSGILPQCWSSFQRQNRCGSLQHTHQYLKYKERGKVRQCA